MEQLTRHLSPKYLLGPAMLGLLATWAWQVYASSEAVPKDCFLPGTNGMFPKRLSPSAVFTPVNILIDAVFIIAMSAYRKE
jgi:hypothetical protein